MAPGQRSARLVTPYTDGKDAPDCRQMPGYRRPSTHRVGMRAVRMSRLGAGVDGQAGRRPARQRPDGLWGDGMMTGQARRGVPVDGLGSQNDTMRPSSDERTGSDRHTGTADTPMQQGALHSKQIEELIAMRDRFLTECFEIESGRRFVIDAQDADERLTCLRHRIEEIHEELARRDMEKRDRPAPGRPAPGQAASGRAVSSSPASPTVRPLDDRAPAAPRAPASQADKAALQDYLTRSADRMRLMDELARAARDQGDLAQAAQCAMQAQAIDRERIDCLDKLDRSGESDDEHY